MNHRDFANAAILLANAMAVALFSLTTPQGNTANAADAAAGRNKAVSCAGCHGESGVSTIANVPHLAGQPALYLTEQLRQFCNRTRPGEVMAVIAKPLSDVDIDDLAAWYESIRIEAKPPS